MPIRAEVALSRSVYSLFLRKQTVRQLRSTKRHPKGVTMEANTIMLGKYSLPFILSIVLGLIYKKTTIKDDLKPYIATAAGALLGIAAMFYNENADLVNFAMVADYILAGGIGGAAATGIYEMNKAGPTGKTYIAIDENGKRIAAARIERVNKKILKH